MKIKMYDPPAGWMYGFPKPYKPKRGEDLKDTLLRDGYPQAEIDRYPRAFPVRFWDRED